MVKMPIIDFEHIKKTNEEDFNYLIVRKLHTVYSGKIIEIALKDAAKTYKTKTNFIKLCEQKIEIFDAMKIFHNEKSEFENLKYQISETKMRDISIGDQKIFINEYDFLKNKQDHLDSIEKVTSLQKLAKNMLKEISDKEIFFKKINGAGYLFKFIEGRPFGIQLKELKMNMKEQAYFYKEKKIHSLSECFKEEQNKYKKVQVKRIFTESELTEEEKALRTFIEQEILNQLQRNNISINEDELFNILEKENNMEGILISKYGIDIAEKDGKSFHRITPKKSKNKVKDNKVKVSRMNNRLFLTTLTREIEITSCLNN